MDTGKISGPEATKVPDDNGNTLFKSLDLPYDFFFSLYLHYAKVA